jgi:hypothetical protein
MSWKAGIVSLSGSCIHRDGRRRPEGDNELVTPVASVLWTDQIMTMTMLFVDGESPAGVLTIPDNWPPTVLASLKIRAMTQRATWNESRGMNALRHWAEVISVKILKRKFAVF